VTGGVFFGGSTTFFVVSMFGLLMCSAQQRLLLTLGSMRQRLAKLVCR